MKSQRKKRTILMTGGHITPALSVCEALYDMEPEITVVFAGRRRAFESDTEESYEKTLVESKGYVFYPIITGRLYRSISITSLLSLLRIAAGVIQAFILIGKIKPDLIVSFGGYVAVPPVLAGALLGIPIVTHEQTTAPGYANSLIARLAKHVYVSFPGENPLQQSQKVIVTGLPIRKGIRKTPATCPFRFVHPSGKILYITGGITGAQSLNVLVFPILPQLVTSYTVIHQTGAPSFHDAQSVSTKLPEDRYVFRKFLHESEVAWALNHARFVISRSGANTVAEIAAVGKPAILIPLPWSRRNEQMTNAEVLVRAGSGIIFRQDSGGAAELLSAIRMFESNLDNYTRRAKDFSKKQSVNADRRIAEHILSLV